MKKALMAKIHIAKSQLGLDDDTYRSLLESTTGKDSCKKMRNDELESVLDVLKKKGFKPATKKGKRLSPRSGNAKVPEIDKIRAIWITMAKHGFVRDGSEDALDAYTKRMTVQLNKGNGVDALRWLNSRMASRLLEALKQWHKRELLKWFTEHEMTSVVRFAEGVGKVTTPIKSLSYDGIVSLYEEMRMRVAK